PIFEGDLLGQDLYPLDRLGRNIAKLAKARDALPVDEDQRSLAPAALRASDLRRERVEQVIDVGRPRRPNVARIENVDGRDVADDRAACPRALDDDRLLVAEIFIGALSRGRV